MHAILMFAAGVFPFRTHLSASRPKRGYVEVTMEDSCPLFTPGPPARGHICHTAEILQVTIIIADSRPISQVVNGPTLYAGRSIGSILGHCDAAAAAAACCWG